MLRVFLMALAGLSAAAQTQIDLRTQTKGVDFTSATSTKPLKTGTTLPAACAVGELFFNTDATAGANLYACTATNTWSVQGGLSSQNCWYDTTDNTLKCQDASGNIYAAVKTATGTPNQWVDYIATTGIPHTSQPTAAAVGAVADPGANGIPYRSGPGTATPANADNASAAFFCQDAGNSSAYACNLTPPIAAYTAGTTYWFKANTANTGPANINFNSLGAKTIVKQHSQALVANDIAAGQWVMLTYDGANMEMQSQTANAAGGGVPSVFGRTGPVTAQSGDYTTAQVTESGNLYFTGARARAALSGGGPITLNGSTGALDCPTCVTSSTSADTDLSGTFPHLSVVKLQGLRVANTEPADLQYLGWNNSAGQWEPKTPPSALVASVFWRTGQITAQTGDYNTSQVTESGNLYFTNARARAALSGGGPVTLDASTGTLGCPTCLTTSTMADTDLTGNFPHLSVVKLQGRPVASAAPADLQYLGWNNLLGQWEPKTQPSALVASVFGRTGPVAAQSGDYSFAQISGAASASQLPAVAMRTDQSNLVTAGTQDFHGAAHTFPMKSGAIASLPGTCTAGETYFATDAQAGNNVYGCTAANTWSPEGTAQFLTVASDGVVVGSRATANFETGSGLMSVIADTGTQINIQSSLDMALVQTQPGEQTGAALLCASAGGSHSSYQCAMNPTLAVYDTGMVLHWQPDVNGQGGPTTLNVDTLGATPLKLPDGATDPGATDIVSGLLYNVWYDGTVFRLMTQGGVSSVFGRSGAVTGQSGDYTAAQVTNAVDSTGSYSNPAWIAALAWSKLTGVPSTFNAGQLQGRTLASTMPSDLQYLGWNNGASQWEPKTLPAAGVSSIFGRTGAVAAQSGDYTSDQVTEGTTNLYFSTSRARSSVSASSPLSYNSSTGVFSCPTCLTGSAAVTGVFGRTGAVTAQTGDYTAAQVTNAVDATGNYSNPAWITALAWSKLTGVPSTFNAGQLQGRTLASTTPSDLQYLGWNDSASQWEPKTLPAGGTGGSGDVSSVFGRSGAVTAQSGDYTAAQVGAEPAITAGTTSQYWRGDKSWQTLPAFPSGTIVGATDTQTLTNKTLASASLGSGASPITETWTAGAGGVTANTLVQVDSSAPSKIVAASTGVYGIAMSSAAANATLEVARMGTVNCVTDTGGATAGDLAIIGTGTVIDCKDSGQTSSANIPITSRVVGAFRSSATAGSTALVELTPAHFGTQIAGVGVDGVSPTTMGYVDPTSSIQTQLNGKQASGAYATCTGDLSGTAPGCTVSKINGGTLPTSASAVGTDGNGKIVAATVNDTRVFQGAVCYGTTAGTGFTVLPNNYGTPSCNADQNPTLHFMAGSQNNALQHWPLPKTWSGTVDAQIKWRSAATSGNVVWGVQTIAVPDGEILAQTLGTTTTVTTAAPSTSLAPKTDTLTAIPISNASSGTYANLPGTCTATAPAPVYLATDTNQWYWCSGTNTWSTTTGVELQFQLYRNGASASDTMTGDAELIWLAMRFNVTGSVKY